MDSLMNMGNQQRAALAAALAAGLSGSDAAPLYDQWQTQQTQALAQRQGYLGGLDQTITAAAENGMTRDQAEMLLRSQRIAAGAPTGSAIAQQGQDILQNAYPQGDLSSMPGGLSPLVSKDAAGGIDFQDVSSINAQVKKMLSQGVTNEHDITFGIIGSIRPSYGYQTITQAGQGPPGPDGQPTDKVTQVSQMPMETQTALRNAIDRAYGYYTNKMGIDPNMGDGSSPSPQGTDQAPIAPNGLAGLTQTQQQVLSQIAPASQWTGATTPSQTKYVLGQLGIAPGPNPPQGITQQVLSELPAAMRDVLGINPSLQGASGAFGP